jgi:hypothetical protein
MNAEQIEKYFGPTENKEGRKGQPRTFSIVRRGHVLRCVAARNERKDDTVLVIFKINPEGFTPHENDVIAHAVVPYMTEDD